MFQHATTRICVALGAAILVSSVPGAAFGAVPNALIPSGLSTASVPPSAPLPAPAFRKGDRVRASGPVTRREVVRIQGGEGHADANLVMSTADGRVAFQVDAVSGVTSAAKNVTIPPAPAGEARAPIAISQVDEGGRATHRTSAQADRAKGPPIGCDRLISVLVRSSENNRLGRCLS